MSWWILTPILVVVVPLRAYLTWLDFQTMRRSRG